MNYFSNNHNLYIKKAVTGSGRRAANKNGEVYTALNRYANYIIEIRQFNVRKIHDHRYM